MMTTMTMTELGTGDADAPVAKNPEEPAAGERRAGRHRALTARGSIVGWMLLLITVALGGSVLVTAQVFNVRVDELLAERLTRAAQSFRTFANSPSGRSQHTVDALLTRYLQDTVPNRAETSFSMVAGKPHRRTAVEPPVRMDKDADFVRSIASADEPEHGRLKTAHGPIDYAVLPVHVVGDPRPGALVVIEFRAGLADPLFESLRIFGLVALAALIVAGGVSWLVAGHVLEPVRLVRQAAEQISETDLRRRIPVTGSDDVAQLASTFNRMLGRLQSAFATQRQFVDDAGHELRTPITVIRGQLELLGEDPAERAETIALVTDELDRMSRFVEDLLMLARAGQPDFLIYGTVDLTDLTIDVLAKARMLGARRWTIDELAEGHVEADGQRLTQALMQLTSNAVAHTFEGDVIAVGSRPRAGRLLLWVRDTGCGVSEDDAEMIFERFRRGSGARRSTGAGLGLPIVRSIAQAHGGSVRLDSSPAEGATFTLDLPLRRDPGPADGHEADVGSEVTMGEERK